MTSRRPSGCQCQLEEPRPRGPAPPSLLPVSAAAAAAQADVNLIPAGAGSPRHWQRRGRKCLSRESARRPGPCGPPPPADPIRRTVQVTPSQAHWQYSSWATRRAAGHRHESR